jgi:hypothetical protein
MEGGAREMVLDMVLRFWCRNGGGGIYKSQVLHLATQQGNVTFCDDESCDRELYELGRFHGYCCCVEKRIRVIGKNGRCFGVVF